jgi:hypothetical protein
VLFGLAALIWSLGAAGSSLGLLGYTHAYVSLRNRLYIWAHLRQAIHMYIINHINQVTNKGQSDLLTPTLLSGTVTKKASSVINETSTPCGIITVNSSFALYPCPLHLFVEENKIIYPMLLLKPFFSTKNAEKCRASLLLSI